MRKGGRWLLAVWCLMAALLTGRGALAQAQTGKTLDVIMILDCSNSMNTNDSQKLMLSGASLFMDMCDVSGTRVAVVPFSATRQRGTVRDFLRVDQPSARRDLRSAILANNYDGNTDTGAAFERAKEIYLAGAGDRAGNHPLVIFFSDGKTSISRGSEEHAGDTAASLQKTQDVVDFFVSEGVPLYVIGLRGSRATSFDEEFLLSIAQRSGTHGGQPYIARNDPEALPAFFNSIFADFIDTVPQGILDQQGLTGQMQEVTVRIPNNSIVEANVTLKVSARGRSSGTLREISVVTPGGTEITPASDLLETSGEGSVLLGESSAYANIKIVSPRQGNWVVRFRGTPGDLISVELVSNYDIALALTSSAPSGEPPKNSEIELRGVFVHQSDGSPYDDPFLYGSESLVEATATHNDVPIEGFVFSPDRPDAPSALVANLRLDQSGEYAFQLKVNGAGIERESERLLLRVTNTPPVRTGAEPPPLTLGVDPFLFWGAEETHDVPLAGYFTDADGDALTYRYRATPELSGLRVTPMPEAGVLRLTPEAPWEGRLEIFASDGEAESAGSLSLHVRVESIRGKVLRIGALCLLGLLVLLTLLILLYRKTRPRFPHNAVLRLSFVGIDDFSMAPRLQLNLDRYRTRKRSLWEMMDDADANHSPLLKSFAGELSRVVLSPKRGGTLWVRYEGRAGELTVIPVSNPQSESAKGFPLTGGGMVRVVLTGKQSEEDPRYIQFTYMAQ